VFRGEDTASQFCVDVMTEQCKNVILVAHNAKSFDSYPISYILIDKHAIRPDEIIYSGSKMYMRIDKKLNLTFIESLIFIPMKLAKLSETCGLKQLSKGSFPHFFKITMKIRLTLGHILHRIILALITCPVNIEQHSWIGTIVSAVNVLIFKRRCINTAVQTWIYIVDIVFNSENF